MPNKYNKLSQNLHRQLSYFKQLWLKKKGLVNLGRNVPHSFIETAIDDQIDKIEWKFKVVGAKV